MSTERPDDHDDRTTAPAQEGPMSTDPEHGTSTEPLPTETTRVEPAPWEVADDTDSTTGTTAARAEGTAQAADGPRPGGPTTALPVPVATDLRVGTVVWGLVLAAIGAGLLAAAAGLAFDVELAVIGLVALAGVGLVAGTVVTSIRRSRRTEGAPR